MKVIVDDYGDGFSLIPENNSDKAVLRNLHYNAMKQSKAKEFDVVVMYGRLCGEKYGSDTPLQMHIGRSRASWRTYSHDYKEVSDE